MLKSNGSKAWVRLYGILIAVVVGLVLASRCVLAQQSAAPQLPPSEELKLATEPLNSARSQTNDLTRADLVALSVGVSRAVLACGKLEPTLEEITRKPEELLALARLCIFGQQFESARRAATRYLTLPQPPEREKAILLLIQSFLGLKNPVAAAGQVYSLENDYPYDAQIQFATDDVILSGALLSDDANASVLGLCGDELKKTLPSLESGKGLSGEDGEAGPTRLFADAVRCLDIARDLHDVSAQKTLLELRRVIDLPAWQNTAELASMHSALARAEMVGKPSPIQMISARLIHAVGPVREYKVALSRGIVLLVPFT